MIHHTLQDRLSEQMEDIYNNGLLIMIIGTMQYYIYFYLFNYGEQFYRRLLKEL